MLLLDLARSISLDGGGGGLEEEPELRMWSFSIGGGGLSASGSGVDPDSGSFGRSGAPITVNTEINKFFDRSETHHAYWSALEPFHGPLTGPRSLASANPLRRFL